MQTILRLAHDRFTAAWLVLVGATLISWLVGTDHGFDSHTATTTLIMIVAFVKARLVGLYFMELQGAPLPLRGIFEGYCLAVCGMVLGIYHLA
jgi:heme/copper-type cytochrome/quinol oxidase subunit 4